MLAYRIFIGLVLLVNTARLSDTSHESDADNAQKARDEHAEKQFSEHVEKMTPEQKAHCNVIKHLFESGEYSISKEDIHCGTISVKPCSMTANELNFTPMREHGRLVNIYTDGIRQYLSDLELRKYRNNWEKYIGVNRTTDERRTASTNEKESQGHNEIEELSVSEGKRKRENEEEDIKLIRDLSVLLSNCQEPPFKLDPSKNGLHDYGTVLAALATVGEPEQSLIGVNTLCTCYREYQFVSSWNDWKKIRKYNNPLDDQTLIDEEMQSLVLAESNKNKPYHILPWGIDEIIWNMGLRLIPFDQFESLLKRHCDITDSLYGHFFWYREGSIFANVEQAEWREMGHGLLCGNVLSFMMDAWGERGNATTEENYFSSPQYLMVLDDFGKVLQFYKNRKAISDSHWAQAFADDLEDRDLADIISSGGGHLMIEVTTGSDSVYTIEFKIVHHLTVSKDSRQCISKSIAKTSQAVKLGSGEMDHEQIINGGILRDIVQFNPGTSKMSFVPGDPQFELLISYISHRDIIKTYHPLFTTCDDYTSIRNKFIYGKYLPFERGAISCSSDEYLGATNGSDNSRESNISRESFQSSGSNHLEFEQTSSPSIGTRLARLSLSESQGNLVFPLSDSPNESGERSATSGQKKLKTSPKAASKLSLNPVKQAPPPKEELMTKSLSASLPCVATAAAAETFMAKMGGGLRRTKKIEDKTDVRKNATISK